MGQGAMTWDIGCGTCDIGHWEWNTGYGTQIIGLCYKKLNPFDWFTLFKKQLFGFRSYLDKQTDFVKV